MTVFERASLITGLMTISLCGSATAARAQVARPSDVVVPQACGRAFQNDAGIQITAVDAGVVIVEQVATTTLDITLRNPGSRRREAVLAVPVPDGAVVGSFTFQGSGSEPSAELLPRAEARRLYDSIVARVRDPALLEFVGLRLIRSSVFPVDAGGTQRVRLSYEHLLAADGQRVDYVLPRTEALDYDVPWKIAVRIDAKAPISTVYSPSHPLDVERSSAGKVAARTPETASRQPGSFRLSYLKESGEVTASLLAYPEATGDGGYFLLLGGLPALPAGDGAAVKREVTVVLDRSGSMRGEKLEQARNAALQVLEGLEDGEAFNIVVYSQGVDLFSPRPLVKNKETAARARAFVKSLRADGGTNLHDALVEALRPQPHDEMLPIVLFLTDGLPTVGKTSEVAIRDVAMRSNPHERRVFTFGVGVDVNTPLLDRIASETRASSTYVLPGESVEVKVSRAFRHLSGPVLAGGSIRVTDAEGAPAPSRARDVLPDKLPDLFDGDQLVLLGRYHGVEPLGFVVEGDYRGRKRRFEFTFELDRATVRNAFVPRLWASRKIAVLVDAIRQLGAETTPALASAGATAAAPDPRLKELVDEVIRLSTEFGILTEYTAFLAREGTDLTRRDDVLVQATRNFAERAVGCRSGAGAVNQGLNIVAQKSEACLNLRNSFIDADLNRVEISGVQQICDRAFYRRGGRWVDSRVVEREAVEPDRVIEFGSREFGDLISRLVRQGRQGCVALRGDVLLIVDGETVLVKGPPETEAASDTASVSAPPPAGTDG